MTVEKGGFASFVGLEFKHGWAAATGPSTDSIGTSGNGGSIHIQREAGVSLIDDCGFTLNAAEGHGGALYVGGKVKEVKGSTFTNNEAAGIQVYTACSGVCVKPAKPILKAAACPSTFTDTAFATTMKARAETRGVYCERKAPSKLDRVPLSYTTCPSPAAYQTTPASFPLLPDAAMLAEQQRRGGCCLLADGFGRDNTCRPFLVDTTSVSWGGAIYVKESVAGIESTGQLDLVSDSTFDRNSGAGAAIGNSGLIGAIKQCAFAGNIATPNSVGGGALLNHLGGTIVLVDGGTFTSNLAPLENYHGMSPEYVGASPILALFGGGAILNFGEIDTVKGATFSGNQAHGRHGGAILNYHDKGSDGDVTTEPNYEPFNGKYYQNTRLAFLNIASAPFAVTRIKNILACSFLNNGQDLAASCAGANARCNTMFGQTPGTLSRSDVREAAAGPPVLVPSFKGFPSGNEVGGAVANVGGVIALIADSTFNGNTALFGSAIANIHSGVVQSERCTFQLNRQMVNPTFANLVSAINYDSSPAEDTNGIKALLPHIMHMQYGRFPSATGEGGNHIKRGGAIYQAHTESQISIYDATFTNNNPWHVVAGSPARGAGRIMISGATISGNGGFLSDSSTQNSGTLYAAGEYTQIQLIAVDISSAIRRRLETAVPPTIKVAPTVEEDRTRKRRRLEGAVKCASVTDADCGAGFVRDYGGKVGCTDRIDTRTCQAGIGGVDHDKCCMPIGAQVYLTSITGMVERRGTDIKPCPVGTPSLTMGAPGVSTTIDGGIFVRTYTITGILKPNIVKGCGRGQKMNAQLPLSHDFTSLALCQIGLGGTCGNTWDDKGLWKKKGATQNSVLGIDNGFPITTTGAEGTAGGERVCELCAPGKYSFAGLSYIQCLDCPAGRKSTTGALKCEACDDGQFSLGGAFECKICPAGRVTTNDLRVVCETCPVGTYASTLKAGGKYEVSLTSGSMEYQSTTTCAKCVTGKANPQTGQSSSSACVNCVAGQFQAEQGKAVCSLCSPVRAVTE